jgi:hypothetical protein
VQGRGSCLREEERAVGSGAISRPLGSLRSGRTAIEERSFGEGGRSLVNFEDLFGEGRGGEEKNGELSNWGEGTNLILFHTIPDRIENLGNDCLVVAVVLVVPNPHDLKRLTGKRPRDLDDGVVVLQLAVLHPTAIRKKGGEVSMKLETVSCQSDGE